MNPQPSLIQGPRVQQPGEFTPIPITYLHPSSSSSSSSTLINRPNSYSPASPWGFNPAATLPTPQLEESPKYKITNNTDMNHWKALTVEEIAANLEARGVPKPDGKHKGRSKGETVKQQMLNMIEEFIESNEWHLDGIEEEGIQIGINNSTDMRFWRRQNDAELKAQFKFRRIPLLTKPVKESGVLIKDQILDKIQNLIAQGKWVVTK